MQAINENVKQEGTPTPAAAAKPGRAKVAIRFIGSDRDVVLTAIISAIRAAMAGNPAYPSPSPSLAALATAGDAFEEAVQANDGGAMAVVHRDQARADVELVLRELATYVQHASKGDKLVLMSSGFPVQRDRGVPTAQPVAAPTGLAVQRGRASGEVAVRCARVPTARVYEWRFAPASTPTAWTLSDTTSSTASVLEGFTPGTPYVLQVRAHGRRGASDWSEIATLIAS